MTSEHQSEDSLAFTRQWAHLREGDALVPSYAAFDPLDFVDFLSMLVIAEIDYEAGTMPIKLAGNTIRDFVGFELTGQDFLQFDKTDNDEKSWRHRRAYHNHPCGRYERLDVRFDSGIFMECALTILPLLGKKEERLIVIFVEPIVPQSIAPNSETATIAEAAKFGVYLDIGAGIPS